jgi:hypothetical protein
MMLLQILKIVHLHIRNIAQMYLLKMTHVIVLDYLTFTTKEL